MGSNPTLSVATSGARHPVRRSRRSGWGRAFLVALWLALAAPLSAQSGPPEPCEPGVCPAPKPRGPREPLLYLATAFVAMGVLGLREGREPPRSSDLK